jgi:hypothetical protein
MKQLTFLLLLLIPAYVLAQPKTLKGRIVDATTQEGVAYTNIGIEGTFWGTASDAEGFFELKVPEEFFGEKLFVSAVGYQNTTFLLNDLFGKDFVRIPLVEQTYRIEGVDVEAQSRVLFRIIRTAARNVPENYHAGPFGLKFYYQEEKQLNDSVLQQREAVVELDDETGYRSPSVTDAYQSRRYRFTQVKRNFDTWSFPSGQTGFDELLEMDLARLSNTIFNEGLLNDYDLNLEGVSPYEGDSVWIISYKTSKPDLAHSGDSYATRMDGKIYILMNSYAMIRNECVIEAGQNNSQNRSLFTRDNEQQHVRYHFTATYRKLHGKYVVNYLDCDKTYINPRGEQLSYMRKASALELQMRPVQLPGRDYFEDTPYVENFWQSFQRPE